jgi:hypothetical protein
MLDLTFKYIKTYNHVKKKKNLYITFKKCRKYMFLNTVFLLISLLTQVEKGMGDKM